MSDDDDDLFSSGSQTKVTPSSSKAPKPNPTKTTPHDDDDVDFFSSGSQAKAAPTATAKATFSDANDLFSSGSQKVPTKPPKATPSDDDRFSSGSHKAASKATKARSILSDDDDLFSSGSSSKAPAKAAKPTPKAESPEVEGIDDPLGGGALISSTKATPSSKTTPTMTTAKDDQEKKSARAPLFGSSPETKGEEPTKPKPAAGHVTKSEKPAPPKAVASKPVKKNAGLFEDSEGEEDLFGPPKPKSEPSGSDIAPQEPTVASSRKKPVGGVAMFGGADLFGGAGPKGEKADHETEKASNIAKKQEELFSKWEQ